MRISPAIRSLVILVFLWILLPFFSIFKIFVFIYGYLSKENVKGKVVLVTGASSGIGEQLTYEYAKRGASLVIVARREELLQKVAEKARQLGAPDVVPICGDVSNIHDCRQFVEEAVNHFGRLDHLANNAGIISAFPVEDATDLTKFKPVMDINFWGSAHMTCFAIPHLKRTKGKILVNASASTFIPSPRLSVYAASKAALIGFYETLRAEISPEITITIATLGIVDTEIFQGKHLTKEGIMQVDRILSQGFAENFPVMDSGACAKAVVDAVCRGERYVTEQKWMLLFWALKTLCPELLEWAARMLYLRSRKVLGSKATI